MGCLHKSVKGVKVCQCYSQLHAGHLNRDIMSLFVKTVTICTIAGAKYSYVMLWVVILNIMEVLTLMVTVFLAIGFLLIVFVIGIPLIWFVNDDDFRCQLCRDTKGQTCIGVIRGGCAALEMYPYPKNPQ